MAEAVITGREISESITLRVTGLNVMRVRWMAAAQVLRLASFVAGCKMQIEMIDDKPKPAPDARTFVPL